MCETCGCGKPGTFTVHGVNQPDDHDHDHTHDHDHEHTHDHDHEYGHSHNHTHLHSHDHNGMVHTHDHTHDHTDDNTEKRIIDLNVNILSENNRLAQLNRSFFAGRKVVCLNLVSSPGSGKTTLLEKTIRAMIALRKIYVIEGDQQTILDAERIEKSGAPAVQINTGSGCHLDARMVESALEKLKVESGSFLFIENVGNLVCPALFDLGEYKRVVVISVTEGEDKPLKYPFMFKSSHLCLINKSDLLPYVDFSVDTTIKNARSVNPDLEFLVLSAKTGEGIIEWIDWLDKQLSVFSGLH